MISTIARWSFYDSPAALSSATAGDIFRGRGFAIAQLAPGRDQGIDRARAVPVNQLLASRVSSGCHTPFRRELGFGRQNESWRTIRRVPRRPASERSEKAWMA